MPPTLYGWLDLITRTLMLTETKVDFPWISFKHYCNFSLGNSNLLLTWSNFCFPSGHFYTDNFMLDNSNHVLSAWQVAKRKQCSEDQNIEFISKQSRHFFVTQVQMQCPSLYVNRALLLNSFFKVSIYISCCSWSVVCMILVFPPLPFVFVYFLISGYLFRTPDNSHFLLFS